MEFNLRTLMYTDIMPMFNILSKVGFKDLKGKITPDMLKGDQNEIGVNVITNLDEITNFRKGVVTKQLTIIICADTKEHGIQKRNQIYEIFDRDVLTQTAGYLYIGDYYCKG